nr:AraC family transcriptional regulator [uncultured Glaciecola sp.]
MNAEKLIEYRTVHYSSGSEVSTYITNQQVSVDLCFSNLILFRMESGRKIIRVDDSIPFQLLPGQTMFLPPGMKLSILFPDTSIRNPTECVCIEIGRNRIDSIINSINQARIHQAISGEIHIDWSRFLIFSDDNEFDFQLDRLLSLFSEKSTEFREVLVESKLNGLFTRLLQSQSHNVLVKRITTVPSKGILAASDHIIRTPHSRFSTEVLSKIACMSSSSFFRKFRTHFGVTPTRFANQNRIDLAKKALKKKETMISILSHELGFVDSSHFDRVFRQITGETPSQFRGR